jgi:hypothetical protein
MTHPQNNPQPAEPVTGPSTDPEDTLVVALARAVDRAVRRVERLDTAVAQLAADVTVLARALDARVHPSGGASSPDTGERGMRSWLLADDHDQAVADLADLAVWLDAVYLRYRDATVPSCWLWHPEVVEELWWLRQAHADAYHPETGSWLRVGDWHDRQRPGVARRIVRAVGSCELALHLTDPTHPGRLTGASSYVTPPAPAPLASAVAQVAAAWTAARTTPEPDLAQLAEADRLSGRRSWR